MRFSIGFLMFLSSASVIAQTLPSLDGGLKCVPEKVIGITGNEDDIGSIRVAEYKPTPDWEIIVSPWASYPVESLKYDVDDIEEWKDKDLGALSDSRLRQIWKDNFRDTSGGNSEIMQSRSEINRHLARRVARNPKEYGATSFGCMETAVNIGDDFRTHFLNCDNSCEPIEINLLTMQYSYQNCGSVWVTDGGPVVHVYGTCYSYNP